MYILDTNVVSELRKSARGQANAGVVAWAQAAPTAGLFLSVITVLELEQGILLVERRDIRQGRALRAWFGSNVLPAFASRILPIDEAVARVCAGLHVPDRRGERDALIAATAIVHGMTVVTRNVLDFEPTGVRLLDPWP